MSCAAGVDFPIARTALCGIMSDERQPNPIAGVGHGLVITISERVDAPIWPCKSVRLTRRQNVRLKIVDRTTLAIKNKAPSGSPAFIIDRPFYQPAVVSSRGVDRPLSVQFGVIPILRLADR